MDIANILAAEFKKNCSRPGPSIPREEFEKIIPTQACGSTIPRFGEDEDG